MGVTDELGPPRPKAPAGPLLSQDGDALRGEGDLHEAYPRSAGVWPRWRANVTHTVARATERLVECATVRLACALATGWFAPIPQPSIRLSI